MKFSDAEWAVMNAVWTQPPASARDVLERTQPDTAWAYSTVRTMLARLVEKGALSVRKRANTSLYEPLVTRGGARRAALRSLLNNAFDGTVGPLIQHMVADEKLSPRDRETITRMLAEAEKEAGRAE
ncbi:MAG: BlaI/MecI/CopY family transcriptional regulator [Phycisphaerales bacterium]|nr:BlaI/MecI/CopY family transcriptional regulator [Phycisphaerales bacterium]